MGIYAKEGVVGGGTGSMEEQAWWRNRLDRGTGLVEKQAWGSQGRSWRQEAAFALSLLAALDRQIQPADSSRALFARKKLALTFCLRQQASLERTASIFIVEIGDPGIGELYQRMRKSLAAVQKSR